MRMNKKDLEEMLLMVEGLIRRCERQQDLGNSWFAYLQTRRRWLTQLLAHWEDYPLAQPRGRAE